MKALKNLVTGIYVIEGYDTLSNFTPSGIKFDKVGLYMVGTRWLSLSLLIIL